MADTGLFLGFGYPARGRERHAVELFSEVASFYADLVERGEIESFEPALLEPHGGELGGFFLVRGSQEQIARLRASDEFNRLIARSQLIVDHIGVVEAWLGDRLMGQMARFAEAVDQVT